MIEYQDDTCAKPTTYKNRHTVRGIARNKQGLYVYLKIIGNDDFGKRNHFESVGGGIEEGEGKIEALKREVMEELGMKCNVIKEICTVIDYYNVNSTRTTSTYFLIDLLDEMYDTNRTDEEQLLIASIEEHTLEEYLDLMKYNEVLSVNELVHRREIYAIKKLLDKQ